MVKKRKGMMFVLSSPSGAGKTTLTKKLAENNNNFKISVSHTTRKPRPNEIDGKDYHFISKEEFDSLVKTNKFFEHAIIFNHQYGTMKEPVIKYMSEGKDVLFDIDWQGTQQLKRNKDISIITFFILPPNINVLRNRLLNRHEGQEKIIEQRMIKFNDEISHWNEYNYIVVNDDLESCYKKILDYIKNEKKGISEKQDINQISKKVEELTK
tara:strand:+ start:1343 stop:1975 length:633 start_codon:yes stop_codon:yes gene_type:complete